MIAINLLLRKSGYDARMDNNIGDRIRELRESKGLSREQIARKVGVCQQQIHKYENGLCGIKISRLYAIASALKVEVVELLP